MATIFKRANQSGRNDPYIIKYKDATTGTWRQCKGFTDRAETLRKADRLEAQKEREAAGEIDPTQHRRPILEHLTEFIDTLKSANRHPRYVLQMEHRIKTVIDGLGIKYLGGFDPVDVRRFISNLRKEDGSPLSGITRNEYITALKAFTAGGLSAHRSTVDRLAGLNRIERKTFTPHHPRRALAPEQISRLLAIAESRPADEMRTVRHGKNKGKLVGKLSEAALTKARQIGTNRRLAYLLAIWTGLRRSELKALRWSDVCFGILPVSIRLRAETTKSKRADSIALHPQIEQELRTIRPKDKDDDGLVLLCVPSIRAFHADCKAAGIDPGSRAMGFVDFHALRKTLSTMMATHGMSQRARQAHMRHTDPRLTEGTYMDERLLPVADELAKLPAIPPAGETVAAPLPIPSPRKTA